MSNESNIVRAFKTINDMLCDRGVLLESDRKTLTEAEVGQIDSPIFELQISSSDKETNVNVCVWFYNHHKFSKDLFTPFLESYEPGNTDHLIFVYKDKITSQNEKFLKKHCQGGESSSINFKKFEKFCIKNLLFNVSHHSLVPRHELVNQEDASRQYALYSVKENQRSLKFPLLNTKIDPVAKYYDFKPGNLVKITRPSSSIGEAISYRYCV